MNELICICPDICDDSFYFLDFDSDEPVKIMVVQILKNDYSGAGYLLLKKHGTNNMLYLREYIGEISDKLFIKVNDVKIIQEIESLLVSKRQRPIG